MPGSSEKFPDVFSPLFRSAVRAAIGAFSHLDSDEYLIGVFLDNELPGWQQWNSSVATAYFSVMQEEMRQALPNKLYLGCKMGFPSATVLKVAAQFCDVVSFDHYM